MRAAAEGRRPPDLVWYASYGSNLSAARFRCYIEGGIPPGTMRPSRGARDRTPPRDDRPLDLPHRLYFAGHSKTWNGSPCFIDTVESPATPTHARAYLITWEQFEDVVAQENGRSTSPIDLELGDLAAGSSIHLGPGRYENMICFDSLDEVSTVTFTSPWTMSEAAQPGAPSSSYLKMMITGLRESHAMSDDDLVAYLGSAPGCYEELAASALAPDDESEG
jgi:hypothetical protein